MNEIKVAENKTLKLTNVVARRIAPEELGNMMVALTQLQNFIKSHNAQPIGRWCRPSRSARLRSMPRSCT